MTKILILHTSLGSGNISAANSIATPVNHLGVKKARVEDGLDYAMLSFARS